MICHWIIFLVYWAAEIRKSGQITGAIRKSSQISYEEIRSDKKGFYGIQVR